MAGSFSLSWKRFALSAVMLLAIPAFFLYTDLSSGKEDVTSAGILLFFLSLLGFFAFRWARMRAEFVSGKFTEADFRKSPLPILIGRPMHAAIWFGVSLLLLVLPMAWWAYEHWPKA